MIKEESLMGAMIRAFFEEEPDGKPDDWPKRRVDTSPKYSRLVIMLIL
jgi:hypothetical protein